MKTFLYITVLLFTGFFFTSFSTKFSPAFAVKTIVIDAGHGGKDPGCHGKVHNEKDIALAVALKLGDYIQEKLTDVRVVYTRKTDVFVELQERAAIANRAKADLFVSIHCNAACYRDAKTKKDVCNARVNGTETYIMGIKNEKGNLNVAKRENSAILLEDDYVNKYEGFDPNSDESYIIMSMFADTYIEHSLNFASKAQFQYREKIGRTDRKVKRASLWVLWRTYMPSVLTEIGYLTNPAEEKFLGSKKGQDYIASGLFRAFREYKNDLEGVSKVVGNDAIVPVKEKVISSPPKVKPVTPALPNKKKVVSNPAKIKVPSKKDSINRAQRTQVEKPESVYKIQFLSSSTPISVSSGQFKQFSNVGRYIDNGAYKYTSGSYSDKKSALRALDIMRSKGHKDAFVVEIKDGKRIRK